MRAKLGYAVFVLLAVGALALALLLPLKFISVTLEEKPYADTASAGEDTQFTLMEKMQIVGNTATGVKGYSREEIFDELTDNSTYKQQFDVLIYNLREYEFLDVQAYDSIFAGNYEQAVTHYSYMLDNSPNFGVVVIDRSYYNLDICAKVDISVGLDKDTKAVLYIYLNFYSLADGFSLNWSSDEAKDIFILNVPVLLGVSDDNISGISTEQNESGSRYTVMMEMADSSVFRYTLGISYDAGADRHQLYIVPYGT